MSTNIIRSISILIILHCLPVFINAQNTISGRITDENGEVLPGATVFLPEMNKGTISDREGYYEISNLPSGRISIQYSFVGFANKVETRMLTGSPVEHDIVLQSTSIEADEVIVSGGYNSTQHENAVKIEVLPVRTFQVKSTPNFAEKLTKVPGVDMISKGSGVAKPVIRGLSMNDILILNNGVRLENYQYSSHHPLGIDEFGIANTEVIKGPASLIYGSDAIGGVINFIKENPAPVGTISGDYNLHMFSNSLGITNNAGLKGTTEKFFWGIRAGQKSNADYLQGGGNFVPNSRFKAYSAQTSAGITGAKGTIRLFYDYNQQQMGLVEEEAVEVIPDRGRKTSVFYQQLNTHLVSLQNRLYFDRSRLEINAGFQNTMLTHIGEQDHYEVQMGLSTFTYETRYYLPSDTWSNYIIGFQGIYQVNSNIHDRETILLPDATMSNYSAYGMLQQTLWQKLKLQTGIRYDQKYLDAKEVNLPESPEYRNAVSRNYGSFSGSFGLTWNASPRLLFRGNVAAAFRTPNLAELTSNGRHETRYEVGDNQLVPENSYEADLSMHFHGIHLTLDLAGFYNRILDYIFIAPTGENRESVPVYQYLQNNSYLYGGEAGFHFHPEQAEWLSFEATYSTVTGRQDNGNNLPFIPAGKMKFEIMLSDHDLAFLEDAYIKVNMMHATDQPNAAPDETPTQGYSLFDFSAGGTFRITGQAVAISLSVNNLFDRKYVDHLSTLKEVNMFNPGRNIALSLQIPFSWTPAKIN